MQEQGVPFQSFTQFVSIPTKIYKKTYKLNIENEFKINLDNISLCINLDNIKYYKTQTNILN